MFLDYEGLSALQEKGESAFKYLFTCWFCSSLNEKDMF